MNYQEFVQLVQHNMHETIYEDSEGRSILVIDLLDAFAFANKLIETEREACAKVCDEFNFGQAPQMIQKAIRARGQA